MKNAKVIFQANGNNDDTGFVLMRATIDGIEEWSVKHLVNNEVVQKKAWGSPSMALRYFADVTYARALNFHEESLLPVLDEIFEKEFNRKLK